MITLETLLAVFAFVFGAIVGSFLNVCIHRLPRDLSVNEPKRSFCPKCNRQIEWRHNLPLLSWLFLRGKCAYCQAPIPFRYFVVELITALLFLALWLQFPWILALPYWLFAALLIIGTFVDFEHTIIPDEVTIGGTIAGLLLCFAIPLLMGTDSHLLGLVWSLVGAVSGFFILFLVVELGKKAFGRKRVRLEKAEPIGFDPGTGDEEPALRVGDDEMAWSELFTRESDQLVLSCEDLTLNNKHWEKGGSLRLYYNRVVLPDGSELPVEKLRELKGSATELVIPREAMGFGDVKFIAAIGAFLGWQAVLFTIVAASVIGSVVGIAALVAGGKKHSLQIPFGPYLAMGALIWMFFGWELVDWYVDLLSPEMPPPTGW